MFFLVLKHDRSEGPGYIGEFLREKGVAFREVDLWAGEPVPEGPGGADAVVVMGGPMNVYEEDAYPFLAGEDGFIRRVLEEGVPFLGVCLGAQLLAKAAGGRVRKARREEIGWFRVRLTPEGLSDRLFEGLERDIEVFQWHGDTFDVPEGGVLLADSEGGMNQAFRMGRAAYGLQFHFEVTPEMVAEWYGEREGKDEALERFRRVGEGFLRRARIICMNFLSMAMRGRRRRPA